MAQPGNRKVGSQSSSSPVSQPLHLYLRYRVVHGRYAQVFFAGFGPSFDGKEKRRYDRRTMRFDKGQFYLES